MNKQRFYLQIEADECSAEEDKEITPKFSFNVFWGCDGTPIVEVRTDNMTEDASGPICRVYLNDEAIYENPKFKPSNG